MVTPLVVLANITTLQELSFNFEAPQPGPTAAFLQLMLGVNNNPRLHRLIVQPGQPRRCIHVPLLPNMCLLTDLQLAHALPVHLVSDRLQSLGLTFNGPNALSPLECLALAGLLHRLPALQHLRLDLLRTCLSDTMALQLAAGLRGVPMLRTLTLSVSHTTITPFGGFQLFEAICALPELHSLSIGLDGTEARTGMHCLHAAPVLRNVALSFAYTQLDDNDVWVLAAVLLAIRRLNSLVLDLSFTAITDRALVALAALGGVAALTSVWLKLSHPSGITSESLGAFIVAHPRWKVTFRSPWLASGYFDGHFPLLLT